MDTAIKSSVMPWNEGADIRQRSKQNNSQQFSLQLNWEKEQAETTLSHTVSVNSQPAALSCKPQFPPLKSHEKWPFRLF